MLDAQTISLLVKCCSLDNGIYWYSVDVGVNKTGIFEIEVVFIPVLVFLPLRSRKHNYFIQLTEFSNPYFRG